jgi:tetratricopeptide (TPR) repeat protein
MSSWGPKAVAVALIVSLLGPMSWGAASEQDLARGIALVKSGDFEAAVTPLTSTIEELTPDLRRRQDLSRAYLFLGVAYLELGQELEARGKFREALRNDPKLSLSPGEFSAQVMRVFETERAVIQPKKKKVLLPLFLVLGGGAATAGVVAAAGSSDTSPTTSLRAGSSTSTTLGGSVGSTTTSTTPGSGPTTTSTTTTTTLTGSTTTTTSSTTTSTTTTTTTLPPPCAYALGPDKTIGLAGGTGVCNVTVNSPSCPWTVEVSPASASAWLTLNPPTSGTGGGSVSYSVALLLLGTRSAVIRAQQDHGARCLITQQALLAAPPREAVPLQSRLALAGGRGQVVLNGGAVFFQQDGAVGRADGLRPGANRIEATVVAAEGRPGSWEFDLPPGLEPGSVMVVAGQARVVTASSVIFQVSGKVGERVVFVFKTAAGRE